MELLSHEYSLVSALSFHYSLISLLSHFTARMELLASHAGLHLAPRGFFGLHCGRWAGKPWTVPRAALLQECRDERAA